MASELNAIQKAADEQFSSRSSHYSKGHILENVDDLKMALKYASPLPAIARALDIASGAGHAGLHLASIGCDVTLSDLSLAMLQRCGESAAGKGLRINRCRHTAEALPYADATFDLVTCRIAAHHFSCPASFIMEVARVLKIGGKFILIDGSCADQHPVAEEWLHKVEKFRDPSHNRFVTPEKWDWLCRESGLSLLNSTLIPKKQPDLEWYFRVSNTTEVNRAKVMDLIDKAPEDAVSLFKLQKEDDKIVWWWQIVVLVAERVR